MIRRALAVAALGGPAALCGVAGAEAGPLQVTPSYAARVHPPGPGATVTPALSGYFYVAFGQTTAMSGAGASVVQAEPQLSTADFHSLGEVAVESADGQQIIEIGWTVDPGVNAADTRPHLFSYHWVNGVGTCYNGCGWVQVSATHSPGMLLEPSATPHTFQIEHRADARWWLTYDGDDMGYYPDSLWSGAYTEAGLTQWFGEVAAGSEPAPCTQMGDGRFGSDGSAATYTNIYTIAPVGSGSGSGAHVPATIQSTAVTDPTGYDRGQVTATSFGFGGPGHPVASCTYFGAPSPDGAPPSDAGMGTSAGGGCCDASAGPGAALPWAGLLAAAWRRRRRGVSTV